MVHATTSGRHCRTELRQHPRLQKHAAVNTSVSEARIASTADLESSVYDLLKQQQTTETGVNTDAGGIAGYSTGVIDSCTNEGSVGYPHVGYNVAASWAVRKALSQTVSTGASSRAARTWAALWAK